MSDETCKARGCANPIEGPDDSLCGDCCEWLDRLLRSELAKKLGREPTDRDMDDVVDRILAARPS